MRKRSEDVWLAGAANEATLLAPTLADVFRLLPGNCEVRVSLDGGSRPTRVDIWNVDELEAVAMFDGQEWQPDTSLEQQVIYWRRIAEQHTATATHLADRADQLEAEAEQIASR